MPRTTSILAYREICACGWLIDSVKDVYKCVFDNGTFYGDGCGLTQTETWKLLCTPAKKDSYGPRFALLVRMGLLLELGRRPCQVTGKTVLCYDVTTNLPDKSKKTNPKPKLIFYVIKEPGFVGAAYNELVQAAKARSPGQEMYEVRVKRKLP